MRTVLVALVLVLGAVSARSEQDKRDPPAISLDIRITFNQGMYGVTVKGNTLYPDDTFLTVGLYPIRRVLLGDREATEAIQNTIKVVHGKFNTSLTMPQDMFLPSYHVVKALFTPDRQPQKIKDDMLKIKLPDVPYEASSVVWIGTVDDTRRLLSAERKKMEDVVTRLDALILVITQKLAENPATPLRPEKNELDRILSRINTGLTITPTAKEEVERVMRKLYGIIGKTTGTHQDEAPSESGPGGYRDGHGQQRSGGGPEEQAKAGPSSGAKATPPPVETTKEIKKLFVLEYLYLVATDVECLNTGLKAEGGPVGDWQAFYSRYGQGLSVLKKLIMEVQESTAFAAMFKATFEEKDRDPLPMALVQSALSRADYYDESMRSKRTPQEILKDPQYLKKEKAYQDAFQGLLQKIRQD